MPFRLPWRKKPAKVKRKVVGDITALRKQLSRNNKDYKSRAQAAEQLGNTNNPVAITSLNTSITKDRSPVVRIAAAKSLAKFNLGEATNSLGMALNREILREKPDPLVITHMALALGRTRNENTVYYLKKAMAFAEQKKLLKYSTSKMSISDAIKSAIKRVNKK